MFRINSTFISPFNIYKNMDKQKIFILFSVDSKQYFWLTCQSERYFSLDHRVFYLKELNLRTYKFCHHWSKGLINSSLYKTFCKRLVANKLTGNIYVFLFSLKVLHTLVFLSIISTLAETKWELSFEKNCFQSYLSCKNILHDFVENVWFTILGDHFKLF